MKEEVTHKILIPPTRTHKDGHLFEINPQLLDWIPQYEHFKGVTKSILELINLISLRGFSSKDGLVSTTELIDATEGKLTRAAIQQRIRAAVQIGLFTQQGVKFHQGLAGKSMLHRFVNPSQLVSVLGSSILQSEKSVTIQKQKRSKALAQNNVNRSLLSEHGLGSPPMMPDEKDQILISPTSWAGIIDQALAPPRTKKNYQKSMVAISGTKAIIETRSSKSIMTVDDLMTLFALFTLTVQYHDHHLPTTQLQTQKVGNKTPVYITDILSLRGKKDSGPARDSIRESIDRVEFTDFQLHELTGRWLSENMPEGFKSDRFRFIARTITASEEAPKEGDDGEIKIKPNLYILVWEPSFFEELMTRDYFFLFPPEILRQHTLVFQLYSLFRSRMSRRLEDSLLLTDLNQKIARNIEWRRFSNDLIRELRKMAKSNNQTSEMFVVNLYGYHLSVFKVNDTDKYPDYRIDIKCNVDEVIRFSRAKTYNEGKRSLAPTMPNPLRNEILPKQDLEQLSAIIDGEFEPIQRHQQKKNKLGRRVKLRKHLVEINADELTITLSKYTSDEALQRSITALCAMTGHSATSIVEECQVYLDKLDWLRVDGNILTYEILSQTVERYNQTQTSKHLSIEKLISGLAVRRKVCRQIFEGQIDSQVLAVLDEIASEG